SPVDFYPLPAADGAATAQHRVLAWVGRPVDGRLLGPGILRGEDERSLERIDPAAQVDDHRGEQNSTLGLLERTYGGLRASRRREGAVGGEVEWIGKLPRPLVVSHGRHEQGGPGVVLSGCRPGAKRGDAQPQQTRG